MTDSTSLQSDSIAQGLKWFAQSSNAVCIFPPPPPLCISFCLNLMALTSHTPRTRGRLGDCSLYSFRVSSFAHCSSAILYTSQLPEGTYFTKRTSKLVLRGQIYSQETLKKTNNNIFLSGGYAAKPREKMVMGCSKAHHALLIPPVSHHANCTCSSGAAGEQLPQ